MKDQLFKLLRAKCVSDEAAKNASNDIIEWFGDPRHGYKIVKSRNFKQTRSPYVYKLCL